MTPNDNSSMKRTITLVILLAFITEASFGIVAMYIAKMGHDAPPHSYTYIQPIKIAVCVVSCSDISDAIAQVNVTYHNPFWAKATAFRGLALDLPARQFIVTKTIVLSPNESLNHANLMQPSMISIFGSLTALLDSHLEFSHIEPAPAIEIIGATNASVINNVLLETNQ